MRLKTGSLLVIIFFILVSSSVEGQRRGRWYQIDNNDTKTTFMDSTTVKVTDDQISVWILEIFEEPFNIDNSASKAKRARTQYLFNIADNNYSVIGNLYYDEIGKIISQTYNPIIGGGGRTIYDPINENADVKSIYEKVTSFLGIEIKTDDANENSSGETGNTIAERIENLQREMANDSTQVDNADSIGNNTEPITDYTIMDETSIRPQENEIGPDSDPVNLPYKTNDIPPNAKVAQIYNPVNREYIELVSAVPEQAEEVVEEVKPEPQAYNLESEKNITSTIFSDGKLFCFQISSWKDKNIAQREVNKLKAKGHNAYFVEANPSNKRGTWYRVRIGYFNSRDEARNYQRNVK